MNAVHLWGCDEMWTKALLPGHHCSLPCTRAVLGAEAAHGCCRNRIVSVWTEVLKFYWKAYGVSFGSGTAKSLPESTFPTIPLYGELLLEFKRQFYSFPSKNYLDKICSVTSDLYLVFLSKNGSLFLGLQPVVLLQYLDFESSQEVFSTNSRTLGQDLFVTRKIHKSPETELQKHQHFLS